MPDSWLGLLLTLVAMGLALGAFLRSGDSFEDRPGFGDEWGGIDWGDRDSGTAPPPDDQTPAEQFIGPFGPLLPGWLFP